MKFFENQNFFVKLLTMIFRWRKKKILDTARKNMVEGKCLKCNHRAPKCDKARRRASLMAPAFYENYETPKTLG